ncbi:MAG: MFS transporter [Gammaproteobacteria bacterium]|nr:MFS transporter [Gammaproteobacteria bacterium]MDH5304024.1 MFS transporter [Gammaproteobacteria bacterium]MDH5321669.1 MFS transporter [Gammaproteobacteria bacterium]
MNQQAPKQFADKFWLLWGSQAASLTGSFAVQFAIIWWLTSTTGSATILASATLIGLLPQVVLGPFIGALVDRWNRKRVMLAADSVIALASAWLAWMFFVDAASIVHVFIVLGIRAVGGAFHGPAMLASTSLMVPEKHYVRIQGLNQALQNGSPLLAAPLGALLVSWLPMSSILMIDVATALIAIIPLLFVKVPQPDARPIIAAHPSVLADVAEGIRYLRAHREQTYLVIGATFVNFCLVPAFALLPLYVLEVLSGGAWYLSILQLLFGVGGVAGGSLLASWGGFERGVHTVLAAFTCLGAAALCMGIAPADSNWIPAASMFLVGAAAAMLNGAIMAILQSQVAANYQGRLFTLLASLAGAMTPLSLLLAAPVAESFGIRFWYLAGGVSCLLVAGLAAFCPVKTRVPERTIDLAGPDSAP